MAMKLHHKLKIKLTNWLTKETPSAEISPHEFDLLKYEIRPGDVLLIEGQSRVSEVIRTITQSPWTHAALYVGRLHEIEDNHLRKTLAVHLKKRENVRLVIEGLLGQGIIVTPLSEYRHHRIRICRAIGISPPDVDLVIAYAIKSLGRRYNVRQLLDLARFLLPWSILPRRWGSSLFKTPTGEPESGICSSLLAEAFNSIHFPILPFLKGKDEFSGVELIKRNPHLFTPKDFDYSPYFEIIKYPVLNPAEETPYYRRLPWAQNGMLYQDHGVVDHLKPKKKKLFRHFIPTFRKSKKSSDHKE